MGELIKDGKKVIALAQGGIEFYPYDSTNDKFTKDRKEYTSSGSLNYVGKKVDFSRMPGADDGFPACAMESIHNGDNATINFKMHPIGASSSYPETILAETFYDNKIYLALNWGEDTTGEQPHTTDGSAISYGHYIWVKYDDVKNYIAD